MEQKLYYTKPTDEIFEEVKNASIKIWSGYDDKFGYATEKMNKVYSIDNVKRQYDVYAWYV